MVKTKPGSQPIKPTPRRNGWWDEVAEKIRQTDFLFGDKQENDTHIKEEEGDRLESRHIQPGTVWKSSSREPTATQIGRHRDRQREEWTVGDKSCLDRR